MTNEDIQSLLDSLNGGGAPEIIKALTRCIQCFKHIVRSAHMDNKSLVDPDKHFVFRIKRAV